MVAIVCFPSKDTTVQYIVNLKLPLGLKNPGGFVPVRMRHRVTRWIFFSSTPWRRRNALFLIMWLGRSGREKPCGHRGCWSFYKCLARDDLFKPALWKTVFQFAKHSVSIGDQKETKLQRATIGLRKFDATSFKDVSNPIDDDINLWNYPTSTS